MPAASGDIPAKGRGMPGRPRGPAVSHSSLTITVRTISAKANVTMAR